MRPTAPPTPYAAYESWPAALLTGDAADAPPDAALEEVLCVTAGRAASPPAVAGVPVALVAWLILINDPPREQFCTIELT